MKLKRFIEMLSEYPMDMEIKIGDKYNYNKDIFKIAKLINEDCIIISPLQHCLEAIDIDDENYYEKVSHNTDDTFSTYSHKTGDIVTGKYNDFKAKIKPSDKDQYHEAFTYKDNSFLHVGGLVKFLSSFPDDTRVNILSGEAHAGIIHEIEKRTIEYFTGVDPRDGDVISDFSDELFIEYGIPISGWEGGGSFPLRDNYPWYSSDEVPKVIAEPIKKHFQENNIELSDEEAKKWGSIVLAIKENLYNYYHLTYRLNGSWDSNGSFHPHDKDNIYVKPEFE